ncbi:hypothetical protein Dimus_001359, partial [Dionaea muscipula]
EYLTALNILEVTDDEAADVIKDVASPQKKKQRTLVKGAMMTGSKAITASKGNEVTAVMAVVPVAESQDKSRIKKDGKKTKGKGPHLLERGCEGREEKEKTIWDLIKEHGTWKATYERSVKDALDKAKGAMEKLEAAKAEAKLNVEKLAAMERNHVNGFNEVGEHKKTAEAVAYSLTN